MANNCVSRNLEPSVHRSCRSQSDTNDEDQHNMNTLQSGIDWQLLDI